MPRNPNTKCIICNTPTYKRPSNLVKTDGKAYCSKDCYGKSCRKEFPCIVCGTLLLAGRHSKTCSRKCSNIARTGMKYEGKGAKKSAFRTLVLDSYGHNCLVCGYSTFVDTHHIIKKRQGGEDTVENGIPLCPNHHKEAENGIISVEELYKLKEVARMDEDIDLKSTAA